MKELFFVGMEGNDPGDDLISKGGGGVPSGFNC